MKSINIELRDRESCLINQIYDEKLVDEFRRRLSILSFFFFNKKRTKIVDFRILVFRGIYIYVPSSYPNQPQRTYSYRREEEEEKKRRKKVRKVDQAAHLPPEKDHSDE